METFTIRLRNLKFFSRIGVFEQERQVGNEFEVNISVISDASRFEEEKLDSTVSYAEIFDLTAEEMGKEWLLLESASKSIAEKIFDLDDSISETRVEIAKLSPPISGLQGSCSVEYTKTKP